LKGKRGFTLVELLIVIALIGVLAVALVATLNPIEQINKATDARYKNDAAELLAAIERYYASNLQYPWVTTGDAADNDEAFGANCQSAGVGVCSAGGCPDNTGELIATDELKDSFARKNQFTTSDLTDMLHVVKGQDSSAVYVCFVPRSDTNRRNADVADIWVDATDSYQAPVDCTEVPDDWSVMDGTCFMCAPEAGTAVGAGTP
jgi:prepilin-type N-terminal cleavage/methylation domain-containing protein